MRRAKSSCFSLRSAGRYEELLALLDEAPYSMRRYREWGVKALAAIGRKAEAIRYAEASRSLNDNPDRDRTHLLKHLGCRQELKLRGESAR